MKNVIYTFALLVFIALTVKGQSIAAELTGWQYLAQGTLTGNSNISIKSFDVAKINLEHYLYEQSIYKPWGLYASLGYYPGSYPDLTYTIVDLGIISSD